MSIDTIDAVYDFCLNVVLGSYKRLAPRGRAISTSEGLLHRDALLLSWAMSEDIYEIAKCAQASSSNIDHHQTMVTTIQSGQISGSIDAQQTLMLQHLTCDYSSFVVIKATPSKESVMKLQVVAWVLKLAKDELQRSLESNQWHTTEGVESRLGLLTSVLAKHYINEIVSGRGGKSKPGDLAIKYASRSKNNIYLKAAEALRIYEGLRRLAPFAVRRVVSQAIFVHLGDQRLLELAGGLAIAEALSIASGFPLVWNPNIASDRVMAKIGPLSVGWHETVNFNENQVQITVAIIDTRNVNCLSFLRCSDSRISDFEDQTIRLATELLVVACRLEAKKPPRFQETPLADCGILMRRFFKFKLEKPSIEQITIIEFKEISSGGFLELAKKVCRKADLN